MLKNSEQAAYRQPKVPEIRIMDSLQSVIRIVRRQFIVVISVAFLSSALGVIYALMTPPTYTAKALLLTDSKRLQLTQSFGEAAIDPVDLETQVEILKSENVLLPVIKSLQLDERPEYRLSAGFFSGIFGSAPSNSESAILQRAVESLQTSLSAMQSLKDANHRNQL